jgi:hypothetical protein
MFKSFDRKKVLLKLTELIEKKFGTMSELTSWTIQETAEIFKVLESRKQEAAISKSLQ